MRRAITERGSGRRSTYSQRVRSSRRQGRSDTTQLLAGEGVLGQSNRNTGGPQPPASAQPLNRFVAEVSRLRGAAPATTLPIRGATGYAAVPCGGVQSAPLSPWPSALTAALARLRLRRTPNSRLHASALRPVRSRALRPRGDQGLVGGRPAALWRCTVHSVAVRLVQTRSETLLAGSPSSLDAVLGPTADLSVTP